MFICEVDNGVINVLASFAIKCCYHYCRNDDENDTDGH
jgi:hypothetical protein